MRILFINSLYPPYVGGGAETTVANLVEGMAKRGHETAVLSTHDAKGLNISTENKVTVYRVGIRNIYWHYSTRTQPSWKRLLWHALDSYNLFAANDVKNIIKKFKPEIISCHNLPGFSVATWNAAASARIPIIQVLHDYYSLCPKSTLFNNGSNCNKPCTSCSLMRQPHPAASKNVTAVVGVSQAVLNKHLESGLFANAPFKKVIYNARSIKPISQPVLNPSVITVGFIGGLTVVKGIGQLIEAFNRMQGRTEKKLRLLIAGSGKDDYVNELKKHCTNNENIVFLGQVDPATFYNQLDITVVPSVWNEPLGMVVPESLGFSVPVIGAKRGGIPEMIKDGINGLIFEPDQPFALDEAILRLINDPVLLESMKNHAAKSVERFLNEELMINEHELLYKEVLRVS